MQDRELHPDISECRSSLRATSGGGARQGRTRYVRPDAEDPLDPAAADAAAGAAIGSVDSLSRHEGAAAALLDARRFAAILRSFSRSIGR